VGIGSLLLSYFLLVEPERETRERAERNRHGIDVDYVGFGLVALGLGCLQVVLDKGEREDWFESNFIVRFTIVAIVALIALVIWELRTKNPVVDLELYCHRSFALSNVLMFALGFILFGTTQLLPQLVQSLYGYTATQAGMVITPGAFAVILMLPVVGVLVNRTQPRYLIGLGMFIEFLAMWHMSKLSTDAAYSDLMWARIYQASGIAFLFIPITTASYAGLPANKSNEASALINLMRNLGGSFGISLAQTWLARRQQFHRTRLVSHLTQSHPVYQQWLANTAEAMRHGGASASEATKAALAQLGKTMGQQAEMLSYVDIFRVMAWCALATVPLVFLLRKVKPGGAQMH